MQSISIHQTNNQTNNQYLMHQDKNKQYVKQLEKCDTLPIWVKKRLFDFAENGDQDRLSLSGM